jgi:hypothetical protein
MKKKREKAASRKTDRRKSSQCQPTIESRIRMATQTIEAHRKSCGGSVEESIQEIIFNLGLLVNAEDLDFSETIAAGIGRWLEHIPPSKTPLIAEWSDLSTPSQGSLRLKDVFISYAAEDKDLAFNIGIFWKSNTKSPLYLGRSVFEDNVTRKSIDESLDRSQLCLIFASPNSLWEEPSLERILKRALKRGVAVRIVTRSEMPEWEKALKYSGIVVRDTNLYDCNIQIAHYRAGPLYGLASWIDGSVQRPILGPKSQMRAGPGPTERHVRARALADADKGLLER